MLANLLDDDSNSSMAILRSFTVYHREARSKARMHGPKQLLRWAKSIATDHGHFDLLSVILLITEVILLACIIKFVPCELEVVMIFVPDQNDYSL